MSDIKYRLPPKVWLDMAIDALGLSNYSARSQLETLVENINNQELPIKISTNELKNFRLQPAKSGYDAIFDDSGEIDKMLSIAPTIWATDVQSDLTLIRTSQYMQTTLLVHEVEADGTIMYLVDDTDQFVVSSSVDLNQLYIERDDLENFSPRSTPYYADPKSKHYAPELALAVRLHEDIRVLNKAPDERTMVDQVRVMLNTYDKTKKSSNMVERLSSIIGRGQK